MATSKAARGPRERLLASAVTLVRRDGVAGTGLSELLAHSRTARGSVYQHFPGGKDELVAAAIRRAGEIMARGIGASAARDDPVAVVEQAVATAKRGLAAHDFALGCPVVAAATSGPGHAPAVRAAADSFALWTDRLRAGFVRAGMRAPVAEGFASLVVSAVEGAIVQARASGTLDPLDHVAGQLAALARHHLDAGAADR